MKVLNEGDMADLYLGQWDAPKHADANNCHAVLLHGQLEEARLARALRALQARHPRARARGLGASRGHVVLVETDAPIPLAFVRGAADSINASLEEALLRTCDFERGPVLACTVVSHAPEPTCLLILGGSHGAADGVGLTIALADLLKAYDLDAPLPQVVPPQMTSQVQMHQARGGRGDLSLSAVEVARAREVEARFPTRDPCAVNQSFVDHEHPDYRPVFEGVAIETLRLSSIETSGLRAAAREAGTTVTGAVAAGLQFCVLKSLLARGRVTEVISLSVEMNGRFGGRDAAAPAFADELGSFVSGPTLHLPVRTEFWECARLTRRFISAHVEAHSAFPATVVGQGLVGKADFMLLRALQPAALASASKSEHCIMSSLGVLDRFGEYGAFRVLENYTAAHAAFAPLKVNLCTCAPSGCLTACVMVTKNVVPDARQLACGIRDDLLALLQHLPEVAKVPDLRSPGLHQHVIGGGSSAQAREEEAFTGYYLQKLAGVRAGQEEPVPTPRDACAPSEAEARGGGMRRPSAASASSACASEAGAAEGGRRPSLIALLVEPLRRLSVSSLGEAVLQPLNDRRRLSVGEATVEGDLEEMGTRMDALMQRNRLRAATAVRAPDGSAFLGDTSGASSCWTHLQLCLCVLLTLVCTGPLISFPLYQGQLAQSGVLASACGGEPAPCDAQNAALTAVYQTTGGILPLLAFLPGFAFDILGGRRHGLVCGLGCACGMFGIAVAIQMDPWAYPVGQVLLLGVSLIAAELLGQSMNLAMLGWLWHYPSSQGRLLGISNGTSQASGALAFLFHVMKKAGLSLQQDVIIMAAAGTLSSLVLPLLIPPREDFAREAGRVLAEDPSTISSGGVPASALLWHIRHNRQCAVKVARLHPRQNAAFLFWMVCTMVSFFLFMGGMSTRYKAWFSGRERDVLNDALALCLGLAGIVMGPLLGYVMDIMGFLPFVGVTALSGFLFAVAFNVPTVSGQIMAIGTICSLISVVSVFTFRYTILFAPPDLMGSFVGLGMTVTSVGMIAIMALSMALPAWASAVIISALPAVGGFVFLIVLCREGLPAKPPKNAYG